MLKIKNYNNNYLLVTNKIIMIHLHNKNHNLYSFNEELFQHHC